jgi:hypothetical protein
MGGNIKRAFLRYIVTSLHRPTTEQPPLSWHVDLSADGEIGDSDGANDSAVHP